MLERKLITQAINYQKLGYTDIKVNHENYTHGQPTTVGGYTKATLNEVNEFAKNNCITVNKYWYSKYC